MKRRRKIKKLPSFITKKMKMAREQVRCRDDIRLDENLWSESSVIALGNKSKSSSAGGLHEHLSLIVSVQQFKLNNISLSSLVNYYKASGWLLRNELWSIKCALVSHFKKWYLPNKCLMGFGNEFAFFS